MCPGKRSMSALLWPSVEEEEQHFRVAEAFRILDRDGDGAIKGHDLSAFFDSLVGESLSDEEAASMIAMADLDGDGAVGLQEFQRLLSASAAAAPRGAAALLRADRQRVERAALRRVFDVLDVNNDGQLSRSDLRAAMTMSGHPLSERDLDAMFLAATQFPSLTIDFDAFTKLISSSVI